MADETAPSSSTVRIDNELLEAARIICAHTKKPSGRPLKIAELLDSILRGPLLTKREEVLRKVADDQPKRKPPKGDK